MYSMSCFCGVWYTGGCHIRDRINYKQHITVLKEGTGVFLNSKWNLDSGLNSAAFYSLTPLMILNVLMCCMLDLKWMSRPLLAEYSKQKLCLGENTLKIAVFCQMFLLCNFMWSKLGKCGID